MRLLLKRLARAFLPLAIFAFVAHGGDARAASLMLAIALAIVLGPYVFDHLRARRVRTALDGLPLVGAKTRENGLAFVAQDLAVEVTLEPGGEDDPKKTIVRVQGAAALLLLRLSVETEATTREVYAGRALDVQIGSPELDAAYTIEGAPATLVADTMLDPTVSSGLLELRPRVVVEGGRVELVAEGWDAIRTLVELGLAVAHVSRRLAAQSRELPADVAEFGRLRRVEASREIHRTVKVLWGAQLMVLLWTALVTALALGYIDGRLSFPGASLVLRLGLPPMFVAEVLWAGLIGAHVLVPTALDYAQATARAPDLARARAVWATVALDVAVLAMMVVTFRTGR